VQQNPDPAGLNVALHELLRGSFKKGDFAASIFEALCAGKPLQCPGYISDALAWLQEELEPTTAGGQA
jgi:hypothetical protein